MYNEVQTQLEEIRRYLIQCDEDQFPFRGCQPPPVVWLLSAYAANESLVVTSANNGIMFFIEN
jgi:hypothetical protein